ncbi:DUF6022 family protein [Paenibacillus nasutitermitis]|uniref:Uncharacterized protein n=1 Tax=Paenibacillus nasutitermitis TaxID=1652958 RepID=A0A916YXL7_9BACL|nr:DUF6022 family protein [Paenibacillus nasutitermitis]GGD66149.1 hypothetical protein GCM10010911_24880 [Paenibacillus nasutitermitis]
MNRQEPIFMSSMSISEIGEEGNRYIGGLWESLYKEMHTQLTAAFLEIEDAAYGLYLDRLMPPLFDRLEEAGFQAADPAGKDDFIIGKCLNFSNSLEKWGTEDNRSRLFWNVIQNERQEPVGTLITEIPHSHHKFDVPTAPKLYVLTETDRESITAGIRRIKGS